MYKKEVLICLAVLLCGGCRKKDRLSASTLIVDITPPAASVSLGNPKTFTAAGIGPSGTAFEINPTWALVPSTGIGTINTTIGSSVVFTPVAIGTVTLNAAWSDVTGQTQIKVVAPTSAAVVKLTIYDDNGLPAGVDSNILTWFEAGKSVTYTETTNANIAPEGSKFQTASSVNAGFFGWGVVICQSTTPVCQGEDLSGFASSGQLKFNLRISRSLSGAERFKVEVEDVNLQKTLPAVFLSAANGFSSTSSAWQDISIAGTELLTGNIVSSKARLPFEITVENAVGSLTFNVDNIRWER